MCLYLLILLRISDRVYERLFVFMFIPVLVNSSWKYLWINLDLVLGPRTLRCTFPIHQDRRDRRLQHLGKLLVDLAPNVMAG